MEASHSVVKSKGAGMKEVTDTKGPFLETDTRGLCPT